MKFNKWYIWLMVRVKYDQLHVNVFDIMTMIFDRDLNNKEFGELIRIVRENEKIRRDLSCFISSESKMESKDV